MSSFMWRKILVVLTLIVLLWTPPLNAQAVSARLYNEREPNCANLPCKRVGSTGAVVFVHGLTGSRATWEAGPNQYWPNMLAAALPDHDIFRVDFDSYGTREDPTLADIYDSLKTRMRLLEDAKYNHIAIIAHSLGGIIAQRYLAGLLSTGGHNALNQYRLVFLLGVPQNGSSLANFFSFLSASPQHRILKTFNQNDMMQLLRSTLQGIGSKHEAQRCASFRLFAAYETLDTRYVGNLIPLRVVTQESATRGMQACQAFDADHLQLAKPKSPDAPMNRKIVRLLRACANKNPAVCPPFEMTGGCLSPFERGDDSKVSVCAEELGTWDNVIARAEGR